MHWEGRHCMRWVYRSADNLGPSEPKNTGPWSSAPARLSARAAVLTTSWKASSPWQEALCQVV